MAAAVMSMMKWRNGNNEPSLHQVDGCSPLCQRGMLRYKSTAAAATPDPVDTWWFIYSTDKGGGLCNCCGEEEFLFNKK